MSGRLSFLLSSLVVILFAAAGVARASDGVSDFEQTVPVRAPHVVVATDAAEHRHVTAPIRAPQPFDLLGLKWRGRQTTPNVAVRVQRASGRWSRWATVPPGEDVPARGGGQRSAPLWTGRAVAYQLSAVRFPRELAMHFVAVPRPAPGATAAAVSTDGGPPIVPRSSWDPHNDCQPRTTPSYGLVDFAIVHHTETLGSYSRAEAPAVVLGICRFHRNGNGWNDMGYNLLVDRFGTIYEGRAGGVTEPVVGAQAGGWNSQSTGIAMIGDYVSSPPPLAAQRSLVKALAWKMSLAGIPATGSIVRPSPGGPDNRWPAGANIRFQRISGHRDADSTECPGGALYALLPRIRAEVAAAMGPPTDVLTSSPIGGVVGQGGPATLSGRLALASGRRPSRAPLRLQLRQGASWLSLRTINTGVDGIWSAAVPVTVDSTFRVVSESNGISSPPVSVKVAAGVSAAVSPQLLRAGRSVTVRGATSPVKGRVSIAVERQATPGGAWQRTRTLPVATVGGRYDATIRLGATGTFRFLVTTASDATNAAGGAPIRTARAIAAAGKR